MYPFLNWLRPVVTGFMRFFLVLVPVLGFWKLSRTGSVHGPSKKDKKPDWTRLLSTRLILMRRVSNKSYCCSLINIVGSPNCLIFFPIKAVEKGLLSLRLLSPVKKDESNEVNDFLNPFLPNLNPSKRNQHE
jgi:hypothetical protein